MKTLRTIKWVAALGIAFFMSNTAEAASLFWVPSSGNFGVKEKIVANLKIDSEGIGFNAAQATIRFPNDTLRVLSIEKTGSAFSFWLEEPTFSNENGIISFVGGTPYGISGASVEVFKITFETKGSGTATVTTADAAITASDGSGTNILSKIQDASFTVSPTNITIGTKATTGVVPPTPVVGAVLPPTQITRTPTPAETKPKRSILHIPLYPDPSLWYGVSNNFNASWDLPSDVLEVSTALNKQPDFSPSSNAEGLFNNKTFAALSDGIWYLHVRFRNELGWGSTTHYRIAVDTETPIPFQITTPGSEQTDNPAPILKFKTSDALSGIAEYQMRSDASDWVKVPPKNFDGSYRIPLQAPGKHRIFVKAIDNAGNSVESTLDMEILPLAAPTFISVTSQIFSEEATALIAHGTALPNTKLLLSFKRGDALVASSTLPVDSHGNWEYTYGDPLKDGIYKLSIQDQDNRGARSFMIESSDITVQDRPIIQLGPISLGKNGTIVLLLLVLGGGFGIGYWFYRTQQEKVSLRVDVAKSDTAKIFKIIENDVDALDRTRSSGTKIDDDFATKKLRTDIKKMGEYLSKTIERTKDK